MAVTEKNQWLHILLIIFVLLAIGGGVGTYLGVTSAQAATEKEAEMKKQLDQERQFVKVADEFARAIMAYTGVGVDDMTIKEADGMVTSIEKSTANFPALKTQFADRLAEVKKLYDDDMKDAPSGVETWRSLATYLVTSINKKNDVILEKDEQVKRIKANADTQIAAAQMETDLAKKAEADAKATLAREKMKFDTVVADLTSKLDTLKTTTNDNLKIVQQQLQKNQEQEKQLRAAIVVRENTIDQQSDIIERYRKTDFEVADGRITSVNASAKMVWLNLGYLDALPNQIKFNVYDSRAAEFNDSAKKGQIKIQRIVGPHTAEAIIINKDDQNPILRDDFIFTSTWTPGQRTKYYLAGAFDLDGDGKSDQDRVKALLLRSGGVIVGELKQDGTLTGGQLDPYVRFLVYGGKPDDPNLSKMVDQVRKRANDQGVKSISVDALLTDLGLNSEAAVISGGVKKNTGGFQPRRPRSIKFGN